jgi:hypothetical protein
MLKLSVLAMEIQVLMSLTNVKTELGKEALSMENAKLLFNPRKRKAYLN